MFNQFMTQMLGQMRAGNPDQPPEERFASQLDQLASMGFVDRQANIQGKFQETNLFQEKYLLQSKLIFSNLIFFQH